MNADRNAKRVYLAGPFFNQAQIKLISDVEDALVATGTDHFSPRKMTLNDKPTTTKPTPEQAKAIFRKDYEEICRSTHVIAVLDWALNPGVELRLVQPRQGHVPEYDMLSGHLSLPDAGTVWEMGCAYALRVPVYLYTVDPSARLNLMLSQSARGVIYGLDHLKTFLGSGMDEDLLSPWKGEHR
jgi:nucleoside 2-deoxyribosyltransferase